MKKLFLVAAFIGLILSGCSKDGFENNGLSDGQGAVSIGLESKGVFTQVKSESVNVDDFYVEIAKDGAVVKRFEKYSEVPNTVEIAPGSYTIAAGSHGNSPAAFDQPIFSGSGEFTVTAGKVVPVNLTCTLQNMKVTLKYTEAFAREVADNFEVAISNGVGNLIFTKSVIDNATSGYFSVGSLSIKLNGSRKSTGEEILHSIEIPDGKAQDHFVLTFDAQETGDIEFGEDGKPGITIDYTVNNREVEIIVPGEDETPVPDSGEGSGSGDGGDGSGSTGDGGEGGSGTGGSGDSGSDQPVNEYLPVITGDGIGTALELTKAGAASAVVDVLIQTLNGKTIKDVVVKIDSPALTEDFLSEMDLGASQFSIINFSDDEAGVARKNCLLTLGLISEEKPIYGQSEYTFKIGGFMSMLGMIATVNDEHKFVITVTDSEDKTVSATCTIKFVG